MFLIRTCTECGSTLSAPTRQDAVLHATHYDLACCDGITPQPDTMEGDYL